MSRSPVSSPAAPAAGCRVAAGHAGDLAQRGLQLDQQLEPALGERRRRAGVDPGQAGEGGHGVADLGVVLHRARTERVGPEVDRELAVAQPGEVADQVALGHLGQGHRLGAPVLGRDQLVEPPLGDPGRPQLPAAPPGLGELEDGRLGVVAHQRGAGRPPAGGRRPRTSSAASLAAVIARTALSKAATKASISAAGPALGDRHQQAVGGVVGPQRSVAVVAHQVVEGDPGQEALVGQPLDHQPGPAPACARRTRGPPASRR